MAADEGSGTTCVNNIRIQLKTAVANMLRHKIKELMARKEFAEGRWVMISEMESESKITVRILRGLFCSYSASCGAPRTFYPKKREKPRRLGRGWIA